MAEKKFTAKDWDEIRMAFHTSIMVDTSLNGLAQNLDMADTAEWPIAGADETPAKYIDLTYEELVSSPGFAGFPERVDYLITILRDTMAFDNPFGEMVQQSEVAGEKDNQLLRNFAKLGIPESYPIELTQLSSETIEFCQRENLATLGQFAVFAQGLSKTVIVSGDFRKLLNAVAHIDEAGLAELLPFRSGSEGLHLPEALALAINAHAPAMRYALLRHFGGQLSEEEAAEAEPISEEEASAAAEALRARAEQFFTWFASELAELKAQINAGGSLERYLMVLNLSVTEALAGVLLRSRLQPAAVVETKKPSGLFARLFGKKYQVMAVAPEQSIKFPPRPKSEGGLILPRRQLVPRAPAIAEASAEARKSISAIMSVTRTPWGEAKPLDPSQFGELEKNLRELEQKLAEREREIAELEATLANRERDLAESEALLMAREKLLEVARKKVVVPSHAHAVVTQEEQAALEQLKAEIERQDAALKEAKQGLREREEFLDESESKLFEKVQAQQEKETELEQREEELNAREKRLRMREAAIDPQAAAALKAEAAEAKKNFNEFKE